MANIKIDKEPNEKRTEGDALSDCMACILRMYKKVINDGRILYRPNHYN